MTDLETLKLIYWAVIAVVLLWRVGRGYKRGFVREISTWFSLVVIVVMMILFLIIYNSMRTSRYGMLIVFLALLLIVSLTVKLIKLVLRIFKGITKLKPIKIIDTLLGVCIGALEAGSILYLLYQLIMLFNLPMPL